jgi:hypothetical protein
MQRSLHGRTGRGRQHGPISLGGAQRSQGNPTRKKERNGEKEKKQDKRKEKKKKTPSETRPTFFFSVLWRGRCFCELARNMAPKMV